MDPLGPSALGWIDPARLAGPLPFSGVQAAISMQYIYMIVNLQPFVTERDIGILKHYDGHKDELIARKRIQTRNTFIK